MKASKMLIANYAFKALDILLPELESGLQDSFWRIRDSSLQLCGELLFRLAGISGRVTTSDDVGEDEDQETVGGDAASKKLTEVLNRDRFHRLLSAMYALRQDVAGTVRLQSIQIWKGARSTSSISKRLNLIYFSDRVQYTSMCTRYYQASSASSGLVACERFS